MLRDKRILITGASSGIGAEICKLLASQNQILAVARNIAKIPDSPSIHKFSCDISKPENLDVLFNKAEETLGSIDIFIANAGFAYYEKLKIPDWQHIESIFQTNVFSTIQSLLKLRERKGSEPFQFAITASAMCFLAMPGYALYDATKFALKGFTDGYRCELPENQHINMIYPIATITGFFDKANASQMPWPRQTAEHVAKVAVAGLAKNKKHIFPSKLFRIMLFCNRFFPIFKIYFKMESMRMKKTLG